MTTVSITPNPIVSQCPLTHYEIATIGETIVVFDRFGNPVPADDLQQVHDLLREAKRQARRVIEDEAARGLTWTFPQKRSECFGIKRCVYAIMPSVSEHTVRLPIELKPNWPNVIKVGYTETSLMGRRTSLDALVGGNLVVWAFTECDYPALAEASIHRWLSPGHVYGEWFDQDYVMGFIEGGAR